MTHLGMPVGMPVWASTSGEQRVLRDVYVVSAPNPLNARHRRAARRIEVHLNGDENACTITC
jgi:hypothetical protein